MSDKKLKSEAATNGVRFEQKPPSHRDHDELIPQDLFAAKLREQLNLHVNGNATRIPSNLTVDQNLSQNHPPSAASESKVVTGSLLHIP